MTDDELERALFALPLEEPPADLRARILGATVDRPRLTFRTWEIWLVGTAFACMVWLALAVGSPVGDLGAAISGALASGVDLLGQTLSMGTLMWTLLGMSFVIWISQLTLPGRAAR